MIRLTRAHCIVLDDPIDGRANPRQAQPYFTKHLQVSSVPIIGPLVPGATTVTGVPKQYG